MNNSIGIDAGASLVKIAYAENGRLHFRKYPINELEHVAEWLRMVAFNKKVYLTGGRARRMQSEFFPDAEIIDEFTATCEGARYLTNTEAIITSSEISLLINIGTGTSWFTIDGDKYERVLGSGIGGGTFMGLGQIFAGTSDFSKLVSLSSNGDRGFVDLLVRDLYQEGEPPIPGDLTASNYAKAAAMDPTSPADQMASLINMISETITLLTLQTANLTGTKKAIYIGSTLTGNKPLQESLVYYSKMSGLDPIFLPNGHFSGAIGAMLNK